jgi:hypothetical protein
VLQGSGSTLRGVADFDCAYEPTTGDGGLEELAVGQCPPTFQPALVEQSKNSVAIEDDL